MGKPSLVDVYDPVSCFQQREHLLGVQHPSHQAALRVALISSYPQLTVAHIKLVSQDSAHLFVFHLWSITINKSLAYLLSRPDVPVALNMLLDTLNDLLAAIILCSILLLKLCNRVPLQLFIPD